MYHLIVFPAIFFLGVTNFPFLVEFVSDIKHNCAGFKDRGRWLGRTVDDGRDTPVGVNLQKPRVLLINQRFQADGTFCSFFWNEIGLSSYFRPNSSKRIEILWPFGVPLASQFTRVDQDVYTVYKMIGLWAADAIVRFLRLERDASTVR